MSTAEPVFVPQDFAADRALLLSDAVVHTPALLRVVGQLADAFQRAAYPLPLRDAVAVASERAQWFLGAQAICMRSVHIQAPITVHCAMMETSILVHELTDASQRVTRAALRDARLRVCALLALYDTFVQHRGAGLLPSLRVHWHVAVPANDAV
uniref:Uncharacterized protein n=1 Tax=viral metagenome TaxID=1070528 RepID=A0A6C0AT08_9ZZZZ